MEWLGLLLLYLISGYMKKRNQDAKSRDIESDPDWDIPQDSPAEGPQPNLENMFSDLFGQAFKVEPEVSPAQGSVEETVESESYSVPEHIDEHSSHIEERAEAFEENIYIENTLLMNDLPSGVRARHARSRPREQSQVILWCRRRGICVVLRGLSSPLMSVIRGDAC